jgi:AraC-like DNA-binding protein
MDFDDMVPQINEHVFRKCSPDWRVWESQTSGYEVVYVIKGKARYRVNGAEHDLEPGDLLYLAEGDIVEAASFPQSLMHCFSVNFTPRYLTAKKNAADTLFPVVSHIGVRRDVVGLFRELTLSWNERNQGNASPGAGMKSRALFMLILFRLSEILVHDAETAYGDYRVSRTARYIAAHYAEKLTVKTLARQVNLDEVYFGHLFKNETGMTVHQYMTKVRVSKAENILQSGKYKIHEAAELCGFSDIFHFYKAFKTLRGFPPSRCITR